MQEAQVLLPQRGIEPPCPGERPPAASGGASGDMISIAGSPDSRKMTKAKREHQKNGQQRTRNSRVDSDSAASAALPTRTVNREMTGRPS